MLATGVVSTLSGSNLASWVDSANSSLVAFNQPAGITISADGTFALVTDAGNNGYWCCASFNEFQVFVFSFCLCIRIRHLSLASGAVTTLSGIGNASLADGSTSAAFNYPYGIVIDNDSSGFALVADRVRDVVLVLDIFLHSF